MILEMVGFFVWFGFLGWFFVWFFCLVTIGCGREGWRGMVWGLNQDMS